MVTNLYQIYDVVSESVVGMVFAARSHAAAIRSFAGVLGDPATDPGKYPRDFHLLFLGTEDDNGLISLPATHAPEVVFTGAQFILAKADRDEAVIGGESVREVR